MKTIKRLLLGLLLSLLTLTSCTPDDVITDTDNPIEEPIDTTQIPLWFEYVSNCNVKRSLIVNGVEENFGVSTNSSYVYKRLNQGDTIQVKIENNGPCYQGDGIINKVVIWKWYEGQPYKTRIRTESCNDCNVLISQTYIVE